jgi:diguanylate cyclase (GGDEF)-like protein/PAS domain S-box-containing protein
MCRPASDFTADAWDGRRGDSSSRLSVPSGLQASLDWGMCDSPQRVDQACMARACPVWVRALTRRVLRRRFVVAASAQGTSEALVDALFSNAPVGLAFVDANLRYVKVNEAVAAFAGCSVEEYVGRSVRDLHPDLADKIEPAMRRVLETGEATVGEELSRVLPAQPDGLRHFRIGRYPVRDSKGTMLGVGTVVDDVTELKRAEERLQQLLERERQAREQVEAAHAELAAANAQLAELAHRDPLTGLANRRLFAEHLDVALARARRSELGLGVAWLDLNDFKRVNDKHGHAAGDTLLQDVGRRLRASVRESDLVSRLGGDEFLILLTDLPPADAVAVAATVIERATRSLAEPLVAAGAALRVTASVGISFYPGDATSATELLAHADTAMYQNKNAHSGTPTVFSAEETA